MVLCAGAGGVAFWVKAVRLCKQAGPQLGAVRLTRAPYASLPSLISSRVCSCTLYSYIRRSRTRAAMLRNRWHDGSICATCGCFANCKNRLHSLAIASGSAPHESAHCHKKAGTAGTDAGTLLYRRFRGSRLYLRRILAMCTCVQVIMTGIPTDGDPNRYQFYCSL